MTLALMWHPNIQFPPWDFVVLAEKRSTKEHRITTETMEGLVKDAATAYEDAHWIEANFGGTDTLDEIEKPISAVLALLRERINQHRLIVQLFKDGADHLVTRRVTRGICIRGQIRRVCSPPLRRSERPRAKRSDRPGAGVAANRGKQTLPQLTGGWRRHYEIIFGKPVTNGWTKEKPPRPTPTPPPTFIFDIIHLIDPTEDAACGGPAGPHRERHRVNARSTAGQTRSLTRFPN